MSMKKLWTPWDPLKEAWGPSYTPFRAYYGGWSMGFDGDGDPLWRFMWTQVTAFQISTVLVWAVVNVVSP